MKTIHYFSALVALAALAGCSTPGDRTPARAAASPKPVSVAKVERLADQAADEIMGTVVARNTADIGSKVQARVERVLVDIGSRVNKGAVLAELDAREFEAKVRQAQAMHEQAAQDLERFEKLLAQNAATRQEYDGIKARAAVARAALDEAETFLSYTRITAPFAGAVTRKMIDVGDLTAPGMPTFTLEESGPPRFEATIPDSYRRRIAAGQSVRVSIPVIDTAVTGRVVDISPSADPMSRTFTAKIELPALADLRPGQFGRLQLQAEGDDATLAVPRSACVHRGQLDLVYVVTPDKRAMLRLIRIGRQFPDRVEILSGLEVGETVVVSDQRDLLDGDVVEEVS